MPGDPMLDINLDYIAAGGNRHPSAADWAPGLLAFGAGHNVALWNPEDESERGIFALLTGHSDAVNAVKIFDTANKRYVLSGGADKTIRIWENTPGDDSFEQSQYLAHHQGSVITIAVLPEQGLFVSGSADGTVSVWEFSNSTFSVVQCISLKPKYLPLTCALAQLQDGAVALAVAGTTSSIQLYARPSKDTTFELQATLSGHENWIRSLDFVAEGCRSQDDILLASASQDKYIRLWRFHCDTDGLLTTAHGSTDPAVVSAKKSLSNKTRQVGSPKCKYNVTFEALLIGHEDWIYTARWAKPTSDLTAPTLLSTSADNSIALWRADESSGVWVCHTRLGEISAQKGSTTATGSTGGFWIGLWRPDGQGVVSLGRTGSWRRWAHDPVSAEWQQCVSVSGHTQEVQGLAWANDGTYLISTGADQTTRLFAEWKREGKRSWHEFARPQIHGYDLNCIDVISTNQFVSGADEKLLRVFNKPRAIDKLLSTLCGSTSSVTDELSDAANVPILGLSNKAIVAIEDDEVMDGSTPNGVGEREAVDPAAVLHRSTLQLDHPPFEEHLARHTLWPEHEKLYGHGYEISAVAATHDGSLIATACKASSIDHAVIRIYDCQNWREVKPPLTAHSLTITSLAFSPDGRFLLSVGRDRQWAVFERGTQPAVYTLLCSNPKGHSRMILGCSWAPSSAGSVFATAGRDKSVRVWRLAEGKADCTTTLSANAPATALSFDQNSHPDDLRLAYGTEEGIIHIVSLATSSMEVAEIKDLDRTLLPSGAINALRWRPRSAADELSSQQGSEKVTQLAAASDDTSMRIFSIGLHT